MEEIDKEGLSLGAMGLYLLCLYYGLAISKGYIVVLALIFLGYLSVIFFRGNEDA